MTVEAAPATSAALDAREELLWRRFAAVLATVPATLDEHLKAATGLNHFQYSLLRTLSGQPGHRLQLADIARSQDSSLSRLSHAITRLEQAGYVERITCEHDKRASWAALTPAGADVVESARDSYTALARSALLDRVPADQRDALTALLTSLLPGEVAAHCAEIDRDVTGAR